MCLSNLALSTLGFRRFRFEHLPNPRRDSGLCHSDVFPMRCTSGHFRLTTVMSRSSYRSSSSYESPTRNHRRVMSSLGTSFRFISEVCGGPGVEMKPSTLRVRQMWMGSFPASLVLEPRSLLSFIMTGSRSTLEVSTFCCGWIPFPRHFRLLLSPGTKDCVGCFLAFHRSLPPVLPVSVDTHYCLFLFVSAVPHLFPPGRAADSSYVGSFSGVLGNHLLCDSE